MALFGLGACGGDKKRPVANYDAGSLDASDGTIDFDAGNVVKPVKNRDAGTVEPGEPAPGLVGGCAIDTNKIFTVSTSERAYLGSPLSVDLSTSLFAIPFVSAMDGCTADNVSVTTLMGANTEPAPLAKLALSDCVNVPVAPAIAPAGGNWLLATIDDHDTPWDVWVQRYNSNRGELGLRTRVSESTTQEQAVAMHDLRDGGVMVAWVDLGGDGTSTLYVRPLDPGGAPRGPARVVDTWDATLGNDPATNPKLTYGSLALTDLGADGAGLGYWRNDPSQHTVSDIVFVALDKDGLTTNEIVLTRNAGQFASVDVVANLDSVAPGVDAGTAVIPGSGAIVYTQAESKLGLDLWFQQIDDTGHLMKLKTSAGTAPPIRFASAPNRSTDVSVAKLRSQYAIVYRALPTTNKPEARIRLQFLDKQGGKLGDSDLSYTSENGGRTAIEAAYDGRVVVSWAEADAKGKGVLKVARLGCVGG